MSSALDLSLDQVISSRKRTRRPVRRGAKASIVGSGPDTPRVRAASAPIVTQSAPQTSDKIIVSNLPPDVNELQIKELFQTMVGPLREVTLTHDSAGRSKGIASVVFARKGDGSKAYAQYHNRLIDGKRPMKIEIVLDPSKPATLSLAARVGNAPEVVNGTTQSAIATVRAGGLRRGGPRRGRGGKRRGDDRPTKTVEDLDAEMEDYTGSASASAPAPAAT